uniref:uncharacterized protein LOC122583573 n=1 Tax=Erigeron canadensis TaxID=72917 RepID=UPI001CB88E27|nr:uncharacterized protein LOC122583573 [Erigeron canadensis]
MVKCSFQPCRNNLLNVDHSVNRGSGPYCFRISGQNSHRIGGLVPEEGCIPKFGQLYIFDTANELAHRKTALSSKHGSSTLTTKNSKLDDSLAKQIQVMLDEHNPLVKQYRMARDRFQQDNQENFTLRLIGRRNKDGRQYDLPTADEVAALIVGDIGTTFDKRDIIIQKQCGQLRRISELHPSYLALQYPLLLPYAEDGYRIDIPHREVQEDGTSITTRSRVTMRQFVAYKIQERDEGFSLLLNSGKLYQQYLVDTYTMIEAERMSYFRSHQKKFRSAPLSAVKQVVNAGTTDSSSVGKRTVLPSSFTGGQRYMVQNYLDAMALVKAFGYPDLFLTFTCSPKWPGIRRQLKRSVSLKPEDKPTTISRMFKIKLEQFIKDITKEKIFGETVAIVYTDEFQKRGLPHSHICVFLDQQYKLSTLEHIDRVISAELPDEKADPKLYKLVTEFMMHGPCGKANIDAPCTVKGICTKHFPKDYNDQTRIDDDGYPIYKRRKDGRVYYKGKIPLDNRFVVGYNSFLLKRYEAHINVEWCNHVGSIKYLFKYINKGNDRATLGISKGDVDEISLFYDCRYISSCEAVWRIFAFDIHYRKPAVMRLPYHCEGEQSVTWDEDVCLEDVPNKPSVNASIFLGWFECNKNYSEAREKSYVEMPESFVWNGELNKWTPGKGPPSVGRLHHCSPAAGPLYYLRILLNKVKGPKSYEDIKRVNGRVHETYKDACFALGLLNDDREYIEAIKEAKEYASGGYFRTLFATMIITYH